MTDRIAFLAAEIAKHDRLYWVENNPQMSDSQYDMLVEELRALDPTHPILAQVHSAIVPKGKTVQHAEPMLSLDKVYQEDDLFKWAAGVARSHAELFRISPKFDGVAVEITADGVMGTRGDDGVNGEDISDKLVITDFPLGRCADGDRGELVVFKQDLPDLKRSGGEPYKTCRAAAVGLVNSDSTDRSGGRVLRFMPHGYSLDLVEQQGLKDIDWFAAMQEIQAAHYPADGLVVALYDEEYGKSLGETEHHPRHSMAFKFANPKGVTKIVTIEWQVGKGKITPVAILEPVEISGCTHDRASLHNLKQFNELALGVGSTVEIQRCGDVIPQISRVLAPAPQGLLLPPVTCPACGNPLHIESPDLLCTFPGCRGMLSKKLLDGLNRLGVENIGPGIVNELVGLGYATVPKVFAMTEENWLEVPGFAKRSAAAMAAQFKRLILATFEDYRILAAMNIPGVGLTLSKKICAVTRPPEFIGLRQIEGVGATREWEIMAGFDQGFWAWAVATLCIAITKGAAERPQICFTGADEQPREWWIKLAEERGYVFSKGVTKKLALLVCADVGSNSSKAKKARQYGVKIMTYREFGNEINNTQTA